MCLFQTVTVLRKKLPELSFQWNMKGMRIIQLCGSCTAGTDYKGLNCWN